MQPPPPTDSLEDRTLAVLVRRTMRLSIVEGGLMQVFLNWTSGSVLIGYLLALGASPLQIGLVGSVPLLSQIASPLGAWAAEVLGRRRLVAALLGATGRAVWILAAFLPQLGVPAALQPSLLVLLVFVASTFQSATGTVWTAWMGDVVPDDRRGRYFGMRTGVLGVIGTVANLGAGAFLDRVGAPLSFQLVLGVAIAASFAAVVLYLFHYDPPTEKRRVSLGQIVVTPLRHANFRRFLRFAAYWQFAVMLGAPFVIPYFLEELRMSFVQVAIWSSTAAVTALLTSILWGRVADRVGNKGVLAIATVLAGLFLPSNWILAGLTGNLTFIWVSAVMDAVAWGAITPAIFNLALVTAPRGGRVGYIALYSVATGLAGFTGGALSGPLLTLFSGAADGKVGYYALFALTGVGRMTAWLWLRPVTEPSSWRTGAVVRHLLSQGWRRG
jgi:MFS family permease